jgi:flagellar basal body rod protein FlgG
LDAAVEGEGLFAVLDGDEVKYTRDGRFTVNGDNELVMAAGGGRARVLDEAGNPITLSPAAGPARIEAGGAVKQGDAIIGRVGVFEFADRNTLRKVGANLFKATGGSGQLAEHSTVLAGTVERSTVNPVDGLTTLIEASRAFQLNANMISLQDSTIGQAISRVGRIG